MPERPGRRGTHRHNLAGPGANVPVEPPEVRDFPARDATAFILPYATNRAWKHGVTRMARWRGRRISVTMWAFEGRKPTESLPRH